MHRNPRNVLIKTGGHANTVSATNAGVNPVPKNGIAITRIAKLGNHSQRIDNVHRGCLDF
ncbi:hypothetical protein B4119_1473 [Parageobacillus caldoxylosilyticus]|uniref:Uncharacterized protein n=1 Tax=Saccharococcus caldoxylosilyticus TaxID=81408 RepID=A0A150KXA7_9BACL|nr:hypothetical protein B4119_1473 [Parageobacillus caldoxylosilyticus]